MSDDEAQRAEDAVELLLDRMRRTPPMTPKRKRLADQYYRAWEAAIKLRRTRDGLS